MSDWTAEKLAQRVFDVGLLDEKQMDAVWADLGSLDSSVEDMIRVLVRREICTNFQIDRIMKGERTGYFYGKYKVLYLVGSGTFARVYRAQHIENGKVVAVKVLRKRYRESLVETEQFLREAKMGAMLRHVNVVPIYEVQNDKGAPFMVMEFVEGQTLRDMLRVRKLLPPKIALSLATDIAAGLAYAAEKGITHRDLKLSNVLIASNGRAKLVDFGLAAARSTAKDEELLDAPSARAIDYATLERGTGVRNGDVRSDLFFAGCIFYTMVAGVQPLIDTKDRSQRLNFTRFREIKPLNQVKPDVPTPISVVINKAMALDPEQRYTNPSEYHQELKKAAAKLEAEEIARSAPQKSGETVVVAVSDGELEGTNRTVMVVESDPNVQNTLREQLKKRGYRVLILTDPVRALGRFEDDSRVASCVVFCTPEIGRAALDAFNAFGKNENTSGTPAILVADPRHKSVLEQAQLSDHRVLLHAPLEVPALLRTLRELLVQV